MVDTWNNDYAGSGGAFRGSGASGSWEPAKTFPGRPGAVSSNTWNKQAIPERPATQTATKTEDGGFPQPRRGLQGVIDIYDKYLASTPTYDNNTSAISPMPVKDETSWRNRLYAEREAAKQRTGGYGGGGGAGSQPQQPRVIQPMQAIPTPDMPEYSAPAYAPPEKDPNAYREARQEAISPGLRSLREGSREAISTAQSLDNPNARSKFIKDVLRGYGQGLESVAAGAGREARQVAGDERREQLDTYRIQHSIQSDTYLKNYQNQINKISSDFAQQQSVAMQNFNAQMDPNITVASAAPVAGRSAMEAGRALRQQFYPGA